MDALKMSVNAKPAVVVRPISEDDFKQLTKVYRQSLKENSAGFIQDLAFHGELTTIVEHILLQRGVVLVAELSGRVVGFGALKPEGDGSVEMCKLHVQKDFQGLGIGKKLALSLIEISSVLGYGLVNLHVTATQKVAINLYESLGFRRTGRRMYNVEERKGVRAFDTIFMEFSNISSAKLSCIA